MNKQTKANLVNRGYTVGDAKDFVEDVLTPKVVGMGGEEFYKHLRNRINLGKFDSNDADELRRRILAYEIANRELVSASMNCQYPNPDDILEKMKGIK